MSLKSKFWLALILPAMILSACGTKKDSQPDQKQSGGPSESESQGDSGQTIDENIEYSDEKLLNDDLIVANGEAYDPSLYTDTRVPTYYSKSQNGTDNRTYANSGLVITTYSDKIGFYSLLHGSYLIGERYETQWLKYNVVSNVSGVGFILATKYENQLNIYDGFFNKLYSENDYTGAIPTIVATPHYINNGYYLELEITTNDYVSNFYYYSYSATGKATKIDYLPTEEGGNNDEYDGPEIGHLFQVGWNDLSAFGLENHSLYISNNGKVTTFKDGVELTSFNLEVNYNQVMLIGNNIFYQKRLVLPEDTQDYTYYEGGNKIFLISKSVNILTGVEKEHNFNIVVDNYLPLYNLAGQIAYNAITYREILSKRILDHQITRIVDQNMVFHDDISTIDVRSTLKLPNGNYYDVTSKLLYDREFKVITSLREANAYFVPQQQVFVGTVQGKKGIIDMDGVVQLQFEFDNIYVNDGQEKYGVKYYLATIGNELYRVALGRTSYNYLGIFLNRLSENLFSYRSNSNYEASIVYLCDSGENLTSYDTSFCYTTTFNYLVNERVLYILPNYNQNYNYSYKTIRYKDFELASINPLPSDYSGHTVGLDYSDAYTFHTGDNEIHHNNDGVIYGTFAPRTSGYYQLSTYEGHNYTIYKDYDTDYQQLVYNDNYWQTEIHVEMYANTEYTIIMQGAFENQLDNLDIHLDDGTNSNYPLFYAEGTDGYYTIPVPRGLGYNTVYIRYTSEETGYYRLEGHENNTNTITEIRKGYTDVSESGFMVANGNSVVINVTFENYLTRSQKVRIFKDETLTPAGISVDTAVPVLYGDTTELSIARSELSDYGYFRFDASFSGVYKFRFEYSTSTNVYFYHYDAYDQQINNASYNTSYVTWTEEMLAGHYIICQYYLSTSQYTAYGTVTAEAGKAFENPAENYQFGQDNTLVDGYNYFYVYQTTGEYVLELDKKGYDFDLYLANSQNEFQLLEAGSPVVFSNDEPLVFYIYNMYGYNISFFMDLLLPDQPGFAPELELENQVLLDFSSSTEQYFCYTNTEDYAVEVQLQRIGDYADDLVTTYSKIGYRFGTTLKHDYNMIVELEAGETVYFTVKGHDGMTNTAVVLSTNVVAQVPYEISLTTTYDNYGWTEADGVYTSSNKGVHSSTSSMTITFYCEGTFYFDYMSSGEGSCDYLIVYQNGNTVFSRSGNPSTSFFSESIYVYEGDVLRFTFRKDGSVNSGQDCASIKNLDFVRA